MITLRRELTLDAVIAILFWGNWCDEETARYRAPQVLEVLRDPSFRPNLAAYAGQTRHPLTRLEKHLDTFETLNGCLMHVLQAFGLVIVMDFAGSARTEEEANSAEFALALVPVDEAACDTSFLTLTNRVAGGYTATRARPCRACENQTPSLTEAVEATYQATIVLGDVCTESCVVIYFPAQRHQALG